MPVYSREISNVFASYPSLSRANNRARTANKTEPRAEKTDTFVTPPLSSDYLESFDFRFDQNLQCLNRDDDTIDSSKTSSNVRKLSVTVFELNSLISILGNSSSIKHL